MPNTPDTRHACDYLKYEGLYLELVHPGTQYQRWALMCEPQPGKPEVRLQAVFFCPYCGKDFRADCHWQIGGRPQQNEILAAARKAGEEAQTQERDTAARFEKCRACHTYRHRLVLNEPCVRCWPGQWYYQPRAADDPTPEEVEREYMSTRAKNDLSYVVNEEYAHYRRKERVEPF